MQEEFCVITSENVDDSEESELGEAENEKELRNE